MTDARERAFSDIVPIVEPKPKPRTVGLTEIRSPAYSRHQLTGIVEGLGDFVARFAVEAIVLFSRDDAHRWHWRAEFGLSG